MNPQNQNQTSDVFSKLPKEVQDLINEGTWETRTKEVGKKYSLKDDQTESLADIVLEVLIGLENPDNFKPLITKEFSISSVVADQITTDIESRVFDYAMSFVDSKRKSQATSTAPQVPTPKPIQQSVPAPQAPKPNPQQAPIPKPTPAPTVSAPQQPVNPKIPEIRPENLPAKNTGAPVFKGATVQQPVAVPRFGVPTPAPVQSMMDNKLNNVTVSKPEVVKDVPAPKYKVDPYREPID